MDEKFQIILSTLPKKPPRSRLEPYRELIDELRQRGRTYREIAQILAEKCQVQISRSAVNDFVRVRARRKSSKQQGPRIQQTNSLKTGTANPSTAIPGAPTADEVRKRIEEVKRRPLPAPDPPKEFHYNPDEPLRLSNTMTTKTGG